MDMDERINVSYDRDEEKRKKAALRKIYQGKMGQWQKKDGLTNGRIIYQMLRSFRQIFSG